MGNSLNVYIGIGYFSFDVHIAMLMPLVPDYMRWIR